MEEVSCAFQTLLLTLSLAAISLPAADAGAAQKQQQQPNVVVFLVDDLGWRDTSLRQHVLRDPQCRRLAQPGMKFTNAYAANPALLPHPRQPADRTVPVPAGHHRASRPHSQEVLKASLPDEASPNNKAVTPTSANRLPLEAVTLAEVLKSAGYATAHVGKWHLGWEPFDPAAQGFDFVAPGGSYPGPPGSYFSPFKSQFFPKQPRAGTLMTCVPTRPSTGSRPTKTSLSS